MLTPLIEAPELYVRQLSPASYAFYPLAAGSQSHPRKHPTVHFQHNGKSGLGRLVFPSGEWTKKM